MNSLATVNTKITRSSLGLKTRPPETPINEDRLEMRPLMRYQQMYDNMHKVRQDRMRSARYLEGEQWKDLVTDMKGNRIPEDQYILDQGQLPLKQNRIKSTIRSLVGQFRTDGRKSVVVSRTPDSAKESEMLSNALQCGLYTVNMSKELDARMYEEFLLSGFACQAMSFEYLPHLRRRDLKIVNKHPNMMFFNGDTRDVRGFDIDCIGEILDISYNNLMVNFGTTHQRKDQLRKIYGQVDNRYSSQTALSGENLYNNTFLIPNDLTKCRVIVVWEQRLVEVMDVHDTSDGTTWIADWTEQELDAVNRYRIQKYAKDGVPEEQVPLMEGEVMTVQKWFYTYYSPWGHVLREGESPFWHGSHPYAITLYPLLDGKICGLVPDLLDGQRQLNRLLILQNMILSSAAKNTLLVDETALGGKSLENVEYEYRRLGGVVGFNLPAGKKIQDVIMDIKGSVGNFGIPEMIQMYVTMLQDISGVHPAMQGVQPTAGTSGALYQQQAANATVNSKDMIDAFTAFQLQRDQKALKTIQQYYTQKVMLAMSGANYMDTAQLYDPEMVQNTEWDMVISQTSDSPVYRTAVEDTLIQFVMKGIIDLQMFLENTTMPFKQNLLESLRKRQEQAMINPQAAVMGLAQDVQQMGIGGNQQMVNSTYNQMKQAA